MEEPPPLHLYVVCTYTLTHRDACRPRRTLYYVKRRQLLKRTDELLCFRYTGWTSFDMDASRITFKIHTIHKLTLRYYLFYLDGLLPDSTGIARHLTEEVKLNNLVQGVAVSVDPSRRSLEPGGVHSHSSHSHRKAKQRLAVACGQNLSREVVKVCKVLSNQLLTNGPVATVKEHRSVSASPSALGTQSGYY